MTFPKSDRVVYAVDTLDQVICQLRFPPILAIGSEPPSAFQERVRHEYPLYERTESIPAAPEIANLLAQLPVKPPQTVSHQFSTADAARTITLTAEFLAVTETRYDEWPAFRPVLQFAQTALEEIYRPAFYTRVGLRYQDVIDQRALEIARPWADLLRASFAGLLGTEFRDAVRELGEIVLLQLDGAEGAYVRLNHGLAQKADDGHVVYLIDADYYREAQHEGSDVLALLDYFREEAGNLFRWAISDELRDALGQRDNQPRTAA
jgi:uncharacterized protein (TIGR04255 family)